MSGQIEKTFVVINGKQVPLYKVPPGVSGLTPEAREALDLRMKIKGFEDDSLSSIELKLKDKVDKYLDDGEIEDADLENYIESMNDASFEASYDEP